MKLLTNVKEVKASIGVNYIMVVNQFLTMPLYWNCNHFVDKVGIQNIFKRVRYQEVLENIHFAGNTKQDKTDKGYKIRPIMNHLNESFQTIFSNQLEQSIDKHMTNFKGRCSMRQHMKMKLIKWGFNW